MIWPHKRSREQKRDLAIVSLTLLFDYKEHRDTFRVTREIYMLLFSEHLRKTMSDMTDLKTFQDCKAISRRKIAR